MKKDSKKSESNLKKSLSEELPQINLNRFITKEEVKKTGGHFAEECPIGTFAINSLLGKQIKIDWLGEAVFSLA